MERMCSLEAVAVEHSCSQEASAVEAVAAQGLDSVGEQVLEQELEVAVELVLAEDVVVEELDAVPKHFAEVGQGRRLEVAEDDGSVLRLFVALLVLDGLLDVSVPTCALEHFGWVSF